MQAVDITTGAKLKYLFASVKKSVPADKIYPAMLMVKDRFPGEWNELTFHKEFSGAHSNELEKYLNDFEGWGVINKIQNQYSMNDDMKIYQLNQLESFPKEQQDKIKKMAKNLEGFLEAV